MLVSSILSMFSFLFCTISISLSFCFSLFIWCNNTKNKDKLILYILVEVTMWKWAKIKFYIDLHWNKAYLVIWAENLVLIWSPKTLNICFLHRSKLELALFIFWVSSFASCNLKIVNDRIAKNVLSCTCVQAQSIKRRNRTRRWIHLIRAQRRVLEVSF